ncbi:hypothetical protein ABG067_004771 [Albugo candida]
MENGNENDQGHSHCSGTWQGSGHSQGEDRKCFNYGKRGYLARKHHEPKRDDGRWKANLVLTSCESPERQRMKESTPRYVFDFTEGDSNMLVVDRCSLTTEGDVMCMQLGKNLLFDLRTEYGLFVAGLIPSTSQMTPKRLNEIVMTGRSRYETKNRCTGGIAAPFSSSSRKHSLRYRGAYGQRSSLRYRNY